MYQQFIQQKIPVVKSRKNSARGFRGIGLKEQNEQDSIIDVHDFGISSDIVPLSSLLLKKHIYN